MEMNGRVNGVTRPYTKEDVERLRGSVHIEHTLARIGAERLRELLAGDGFVRALGALSGGQAVQMVKAGLESIYVSGWQVAADANLAGQTYPDQSLYPADSAPSLGPAHQQRAGPRRPDRDGRRRHVHSVARPRACRRRGRLRRPAQRVRAHEVDDRGRCGGGALRGPAGVREEVRPPRRQGARADEPVHPHARCGAAGCGRARRPHRPRRANRLALRLAPHERRRRTGRAVRHGRANRRGLLPHPRGPRRRDRPLARVRAVRRHALVRDVDAGSRRGARVRPGDQRALPGQVAHVQLLAVLQLAAATWTSPTSPASRSSWRGWATRTSSSRWPASTR